MLFCLCGQRFVELASNVKADGGDLRPWRTKQQEDQLTSKHESARMHGQSARRKYTATASMPLPSADHKFDCAGGGQSEGFFVRWPLSKPQFASWPQASNNLSHGPSQQTWYCYTTSLGLSQDMKISQKLIAKYWQTSYDRTVGVSRLCGHLSG